MHREPTLTGKQVILSPLSRDDRAGLLRAASDGELWNLNVTNVPDVETIEAYIERALSGRQAGSVIPFVILVNGEIVGSSRFWKLDLDNRKAEIGHTWLAASWQRSFVNTEAKFLMLQYAFETLKLVRVQFQTDELNERSRIAILRLGAVEEGLLRKERIMPDGRHRNTIRFSIIDTEWPDVKKQLSRRLSI